MALKSGVFYLVSAVLLAGNVCSVNAQDESPASEVYLSFQYQGIISSYVTTYYKDDQFYLPVSEILNLLKIPHQVNQGTLSITGCFPGDQVYKFDFKNQSAYAGNTQLQLRADDFLIKEIDYYVTPSVLEQLFALNFKTNFNNLSLDLETEQKLPVVSQYEREQERKNLNRGEPVFDQSYSPLQYDRNYRIIDGGFLDYNLTATYSDQSTIAVLSNRIGAELLGGDIQGTMYSAISGEQTTFTTNGLRWRYVQRGTDYFSSAVVGQTQTEGIESRSVTGFKISNKPVEPRRLFDRYVIEGDNIPPQSEVELYLNNQLVDFQEADQSGMYRFVVPLTYGSTNYSVRIFTPSGQSIERSARVQIPFNYIPAGEIDYSVSGGRVENPILGSTDRGYVGNATISAGIAPWLTAQASSEYLTEYHTGLPSFTGTLNARLFSKYLLSASANSKNFYSLESSVVYSNGTSWNLSYDYNPGDSQIYSIGSFDHQARVNLFMPFSLGSVPLNVRLSSTYRELGNNSFVRYRSDLGTRLGRLNVRFGYQDQQSGDFSFETTTASRLTNSLTYSIGRSKSIPGALRGIYLREQLSYLPGYNQMEEIEFQLSRDIQRTGRIQLSMAHNFLGDYNAVSLNVLIDLNHIRSNTTSRYNNSSISVTQNFRGSVALDSQNGQLLFQNRQQVGQSGAAVRLYVDRNNDGSYQDSTDKVITDPAVQLDRSGGQTTIKNGVNYISRLLPYYRYNIGINKGAISNPLLVPKIEDFSIITDPNQYKTINIPFYQSGVIDGIVQKTLSDSTKQGVSGLRLYLEKKNDDFSKEMRTFSDGSFYTYEIPPGSYNLYIDNNQLEFLEVISKPDTLEFEIEALSEGDFKEGLEFTLIPEEMYEAQEQTDTLRTVPTDIKKAPDIIKYQDKLSSDVDRALRLIVESQNAFYGRNLAEALRLVNRSLTLYETAEGYALKGSLQYLRGDKERARETWEKAKSFNPDIYIPDIETLEQRIRTIERQ